MPIMPMVVPQVRVIFILRVRIIIIPVGIIIRIILLAGTIHTVNITTWNHKARVVNVFKMPL